MSAINKRSSEHLTVQQLESLKKYWSRCYLLACIVLIPIFLMIVASVTLPLFGYTYSPDNVFLFPILLGAFLFVLGIPWGYQRFQQVKKSITQEDFDPQTLACTYWLYPIVGGVGLLICFLLMQWSKPSLYEFERVLFASVFFVLFFTRFVTLACLLGRLVRREEGREGGQ